MAEIGSWHAYTCIRLAYHLLPASSSLLPHRTHATMLIANARFSLFLFTSILLLSPHRCSSLAQNPRSRREFVVDSVSSLATASTLSVTVASYAGLPNANADILSIHKQLTLPPIGVGAWAWGDSVFWGYDQKVSDFRSLGKFYPHDSQKTFFGSLVPGWKVRISPLKIITSFQICFFFHRMTMSSKKFLNMH